MQSTKESEKLTTLIWKVATFCLFAFAVLGLAIGLAHGAVGQAANAGICITAALFALLLTQIDRFDSLTGFGLSATLRKKIDEAEQIKRGLQKIALQLCATHLRTTGHRGEDPAATAAAMEEYRLWLNLLLGAGVPVHEATDALKVLRRAAFESLDAPAYFRFIPLYERPPHTELRGQPWAEFLSRLEQVRKEFDDEWSPKALRRAIEMLDAAPTEDPESLIRQRIRTALDRAITTENLLDQAVTRAAQAAGHSY